MGFKRKPYKLMWPEGSQWHPIDEEGLEVRVRGLSLEELEKISELRGGTEEEKISVLKRLRPVLEPLTKALIGWNYTDEDDNPIPLSDFLKQDSALILAIINAWQGIISVPDPLEKDSPNGKPLAEVSIPMVIPSSSHPSLNMPN